MTLREQITNEIRAAENLKQTAWAEWKIKDANLAGRIEGLRRTEDLIEKVEKTNAAGS